MNNHCICTTIRVLFSGFLLFYTSIATAQLNSILTVPSGSFLEDVAYADSNTVMVTGGNLFRTSIDGAHSWIGLSSGGISIKAAFFSDKHFGIAVGNGGQYRTNTECGYFWGWSNNKFIGQSKDLMDVHFSNDQRGVVSGNDGALFRTINRGTNWTAVATGTTNHIKGVWCINDSVSFACAFGGIVWKLTNATVTSSTVLDGTVNFNKIAFTNEQTGYVVGSAGQVYKTVDGGTTWNPLVTGTTENLLSLAFTDAQHGVITGTNGKRFVTEDAGASWTAGITQQTAEVRSVGFKNRYEGYCVGSNFVEYTKDGGHTWTRVDGSLQSVHFPTPERGYAVGYYGVSFKTNDGGNSWEPMFMNTNQYLNDVNFINKDTGYAVGGPLVFRTLDGGETWSTITNPSNTSLYAVHFTDYQHGVAVGYKRTILYTANAGQTWTLSQNTSSTVYYLDLKFTSPQIGYFCASTGQVYKTINGGAAWTALLTGNALQISNISFVDDLTGWGVGSTGAIIHTTDGGATWSPQTSGVTEYLNGVHFIDAERGIAVGGNGTYLVTLDGGVSWHNHNGSQADFRDVFFQDEFHGFVVGDNAVYGIRPYSNQATSYPICAGDAFGFSVVDPYHIANAPHNVVMEVASADADYSTALVVGNAVIDSIGPLPASFPIDLPEGIYKTRVRQVDDPSKVSFDEYFAVTSPPTVSFSIVGSNLVAASNQNVTFQWYYRIGDFFTYYASGPIVPVTTGSDYYVVGTSGCCTGTSERATVVLCNGQPVFSGFSQALSICSGSSVAVGSSIYSASGIYSDTLTTINGCDSIITSTITVIPSDSTEQTFTICGGESVMVGTSEYTSSGDFTDILTNVNLCDSTIITHVIVNPAPLISLGNDTVVCEGQSVVLDAGDGYPTYNWNTDAHSQTITVTEDRIYSVEVINASGCSATDEIQVVVDFCLSLNNSPDNQLLIYPNPSQGNFTVESSFSEGQCRIYNALGQCVLDRPLIAKSSQITLKNPGIYLVVIESADKKLMRKLVVE